MAASQLQSASCALMASGQLGCLNLYQVACLLFSQESDLTGLALRLSPSRRL